MQYIVITIILVVFELLYFKIADHYNIIDKPNYRSSHSISIIRGGGIIFPIAIILSYLFGYVSGLLTLAVVFVAVVSFIDDIKPLHQLPRFASQVIAFLLVAYDLNLFVEAFWLLSIVLIILIGWINAFNFMDGINGISVLYALTAIVSFSVIPAHQANLPLLFTMGISCLIFGFFNVRKNAKTFAGDVGSISLALFLGYFMIKTILDSAQIGYILFFSVYGIDTVYTIIVRIKKKENIFQAHRLHLYQYLVNEHKHSHILIAALYAIVQLFVNGIVLFLEDKGLLTFFTALAILLIIAFIYLIVRTKIVKTVTLNKK
ncbi:MAG TPA: UDP-GlcNAc--UDP-phosphate GlcNAc-1-phosphate transferase [Flavobacterium sp.]|nr:UDP-GlcNAc--UDP-phosphate GlcNAc-1-phosphate transferase [Flavobacterium sp.]HAT80786.1 UDP-GlcNAc--UDP-phosphate GlcNAc-1-phosphate transferase [Flavobacterium sp.]